MYAMPQVRGLVVTTPKAADERADRDDIQSYGNETGAKLCVMYDGAHSCLPYPIGQNLV